MLAVLILIASASTPSVPRDAGLTAAWREHGQHCEQDLGLKGPLPEALQLLAGRGISKPAARYLLLACASSRDTLLTTALMRAALEAGPRPPVSVEVRKMLAPRESYDQPTAEQRALARELEEPERLFFDALSDDDRAPVAKLEAALAAVPAGAPETVRNERRVCLAGALARAGKLDEAVAAFPAAPAYPQARTNLEVQIAMRAGDVPRAKQLLATWWSMKPHDGLPCWRAFQRPQCAVVRVLLAWGQMEAARELAYADCGALATWAEDHHSPFDAYVSVLDSRAGPDRSTGDGWIQGPRLLAKLGRPDLARRRLARPSRECADTRTRHRPTEAVCSEIQAFLASLPAIPEPQTKATDPALLARLSAPALWRAYEVVPAPPGKPAGRKKALALPAGARVVFSVVEGTRAVAVALLRAVDPRGEMSSGGYVVYLSDDAGQSWRGPLHSGFAKGFPFTVKSATTAKVFDGDVLQLPIDVDEIDPGSITFPPVSLRALRYERDRLVRIPIASLDKDSDADSLPDLLEERLGTDPNRADTDGDGIPDALDPLPLEKSPAGSSSGGGFAAPLLDRIDDDDELRGPPDLAANDDQIQLPARRRGLVPGASLRTYFIDADSSLTDLGGRTIRLSDEAVKAYGEKFGPIFPTKIEIIAEPGGHRAIVELNQKWEGSTSLVEEHPDGTFTVRWISGWIS